MTDEVYELINELINIRHYFLSLLAFVINTSLFLLLNYLLLS